MKSKSQHYVGCTIRDHVQKVVEHLQDHKFKVQLQTKQNRDDPIKFQILAKVPDYETKKEKE